MSRCAAKGSEGDVGVGRDGIGRGRGGVGVLGAKDIIGVVVFICKPSKLNAGVGFCLEGAGVGLEGGGVGLEGVGVGLGGAGFCIGRVGGRVEGAGYCLGGCGDVCFVRFGFVMAGFNGSGFGEVIMIFCSSPKLAKGSIDGVVAVKGFFVSSPANRFPVEVGCGRGVAEGIGVGFRVVGRGTEGMVVPVVALTAGTIMGVLGLGVIFVAGCICTGWIGCKLPD